MEMITRLMEMITRSRLAAAWLTMFLVGTELFVFSPLLLLLAADYQVSAGVAGLVVTIFSLTYMSCAPLLGRASPDRAAANVELCPPGLRRCQFAYRIGSKFAVAARSQDLRRRFGGRNLTLDLRARRPVCSAGPPRYLAGCGGLGSVGVVGSRRLDGSNRCCVIRLANNICRACRAQPSTRMAEPSGLAGRTHGYGAL